MASESALFETQRAKVLRLYKSAEQPFKATTRPYVSTRPVVFELIQTISANLTTPVGLYVARASQTNELRWFGYGVGDAIPDGLGDTEASQDDDTNQGEARQTDGAEDFVIEGFSASCRSKRLIYTGAAAAAIGAILTDPDLRAAYLGTSATSASSTPPVIYDPAALTEPPQVDSPFNLEEGLFRAVAPHLAIKIDFDRGKHSDYIGTLEQFPEGAGKSYLKSNGEPSTNNRYRIPEGYLWRRQGQPDCEMALIGTLQRPVVVPMNSIQFPGLAAEGGFVLPSKIVLDIKVRAHGLAVDAVGNN